MFEPSFGRLGWNGQSRILDVLFPLLVGSRCQKPHRVFEPTPHQFNRVEVGRVRWQIEDAAPGGLDFFVQGGTMMDAGVVHDQHAALWQMGQERLLDKLLEARTVPSAQSLPQRPQPGGVIGAGPSIGAQDGAVFAFVEGHPLHTAFCFGCPAIETMQLQRKTALVQKHQFLQGHLGDG